MEVLLWESVKKLGKRGDVIKVSPGYARNYLFPQKLASLPTKHNVKELEYKKRRGFKQEEKTKSNLKQLAENIEKNSCTVEAKANEDGVLFGAINPQMIINALKREGISEVTPQMIEIDTPIKELGVYRVNIKLHQEIIVSCRVWVVEESSPPPRIN